MSFWLNRATFQLLEKAPTIFEQVDLRSEDQQRIAELERLVEQLTMQLEMFTS